MQAYAADLPVKAPTVRAPYSWAGFYVGGHFGTGFGQNEFSQGPLNNPGFDGLFLGGADISGPLAGGQVGVNFQSGRLVWGFEADASWADIRGGFTCFGGFGQSCDSKTDWIATAAARVGIAHDRLLVYGKAGGAWAHDTYANPCTFDFCTGVTWQGDTIRSGWLAGAGVEYGVGSRWSMKLEYNYIDFGTAHVILNANVNPAFFTPFDANVRQTAHLLKAGINYRFGPSSTAPLAEPVASPVLSPVFSWANPHAVGQSYWSGAYLGVAGGGLWGHNQHISSAGPINVLSTLGPQTLPFSLIGGLAGGTVGANWQQGNMVFGVEGDMSWVSAKSQANEIGPLFTPAFVATTEQQWLATARLRAGLLPLPSVLVYATGGMAAMGLKAGLVADGTTTTDTAVAWGWTAGGGVEAAIDSHWSLKSEYLYVRASGTVFDPPVVQPSAIVTTRYIPVSEHVVRVGLNYRMDWQKFAWSGWTP